MLAGVMEGADHRYRVVTPESIGAWGDLRGESMLAATARLQPPEVLRLVKDCADMAMDTREAQVILVPFGAGLGKVLMVAEEGGLFAKWDWLNAPPPPGDHSMFLRAADDFLERAAWALRTGRPLPVAPAALRAGHPLHPATAGAHHALPGDRPQGR